MNRLRALVVDDAAVMRRLLAEVLQSDGTIEVVGTAGDGETALRRIEELQPDLVTLDLEMPGLDGLGTLARLRPRHPALPVIVVAAATDAGSRSAQQAVAAGANDYVAKPAASVDLAAAVRTLAAALLPRFRQLAARPPAGRVLVAEDGLVNRAILAAMLRAAGCEVAEAADGLAAVDQAGAGRFDVIFMDCEMPGLDGYGATRRIRAAEAAAGRRPFIVGISGRDGTEVRSACLAAGMDDFMFKPFHPACVALMARRGLAPALVPA